MSDNPFITRDDQREVSAALSTTNGFICASCSAALPGAPKTFWLHYPIQLHQLKVTAGSSVLRGITRILCFRDELADGNWWHSDTVSGGLNNCIEYELSIESHILKDVFISTARTTATHC